MKKLLRALVCCAFIANATNAFSQTGYMSIPATSSSGVFFKANKTTNGYITLGTNHDVIYFDSNFVPQWSVNFTSAAVLTWHDVIELNDGNFLAFGANQNHNGGCNIAIKISPAGTVLWQREYYLSGTFFTAFCVSKAAGNDPGFVFGGGACAASAFLVRCDAGGNIVWQHEYYITGSSGVETTQSVLAENNAYVLSGNIGFGAQNDVYITKVDSAGNWIWSNYITEPTYDQIPLKTIRLSTGSYAMLCQYNGNPNYAQLLYYFDQNGNITGGKKFTDAAQHQTHFKDIVETSNGGTIIVGDVYEPPMKFLYLSLNASGSVLWQKTSIGTAGNLANGMNRAITKTPQGNFACFGASYYDASSIAIIDSTGAGYCNAGNANLLATLPETYSQTATTPTIIPPNVLTTVVTNTSTTVARTRVNICGTVGITEPGKTNSQLTLYPNPANNEITLMMNEQLLSHALVTFRNVLGEKVYAVNVSSSTVDISSLAPGVYLVEIVVDGERMVQRVVKE